ncbi:MAG: SDR family NAD(P)-dependent oxidoreductase [Nevskiales bacterium]|nr:SDR family NAD(P)-dependent oxidoreductase [Nevskiales bacterium]
MSARPRIPQPYSPALDLLRDRVVLITGAGDGLGRASALACARHGAIVVLLGRTVKRLESTYDAIRAAGGAEPALYPMNLAGAGWNDYAELSATLEREFKILHGLLHCAAHFKGFTPLSELDPADWQESLHVNLTAAYALTRHCLPLLRKSGDGSVVFVSDGCGRQGKAYTGGYGVSKFALEGLMQIWARESGAEARVRFNTLDPGPMNTALHRRGYAADAARVSDPERVTPAVLWLLGPDSRDTNGQALEVPR